MNYDAYRKGVLDGTKIIARVGTRIQTVSRLN
jgi:hypothetical protein